MQLVKTANGPKFQFRERLPRETRQKNAARTGLPESEDSGPIRDNGRPSLHLDSNAQLWT